jgi:uncharacterized protein YbcV (DUF1398 family)
MDIATIDQTAAATANGLISFPSVVERLTAAGVEYYHVDYVRRVQTCYSASGATHAVDLPFPVSAVADSFNAIELVAAIRDSQLRGQKFPDFSVRATQAGVQGYTAFLRGRRVIYLGRQGDQHIEWFPGAEPVSSRNP